MSDPDSAAAATCFDCGYDLRGLPPQGRCPECGLPAAESAERFRRLVECGAVEPVRRATLCLLLAASTGLAVVLLFVGIALAINYLDWRPRKVEWVIWTASFLASLAVGFLAWRASVILLRRFPPGGRFVRRLLGITGWVVPAFVALLWLVGWLDLPTAYRSPPRGLLLLPAVGPAAAMLLVGACVLYVPALAGVLARRVRLWPPRSGPGRLLGFLAVLMWVALAMMLPSLLDAAHDLVFNAPLFDRSRDVVGPYSTRDLSELLVGVGTAAYVVSTVVALVLLIRTFVGANRLRDRLSLSPAAESR